MSSNYTALLIVDAQVNMFDPAFAVDQADEILEKLQTLIALARGSGTQVVFIQHNGPQGAVDEQGSEGWLLHPELGIENGDLVVQKSDFNAFAETELGARLKARGINKLIVAGMYSELCIHRTCLGAHELGFKVTLVQDAHTTYPSESETALDIRNRVNAELKDVVALWRLEDIYS
ncbi:MAG: isochorismatase family protein [Bdellovibrio sp.]